jgi:hypothetical protein
MDQSQPSVSVQGGVLDKGVDGAYAGGSNGNDKIVAKTAQEPQAESQDLNAEQDGALQDEKVRPERKAYFNSPRRGLASANDRKGPGIGIVTRPIKAVFRPLKKANPFKLRIW